MRGGDTLESNTIIKTMSTANTQLATKRDLKALLSDESIKDQLARALPKHLSIDRFCRVAITALTRTPKLKECTPESFMRCMMDLSAYGLEPDGRRAHLIPFNNKKKGIVECTLIIDYKGLIDLVRRDPNVVDVQAYTIRENDSIVIRNGIPEHTFNPLEERGAVKAVYSKVVWKNGGTTYGEPMQWPECEAVRNRGNAWKAYKQYGTECPWNTDETEMWKKTVIRRDSKMWPLSPEIREAVERDDDQFDHGQKIRNVTPSAKNPFRLEAPELEATEAEPQTEQAE